MLDSIASANGKLDDPIMLEWALRHYESLPKSAREARARLKSTWFHDLFIAQLIEREETEALSRLFRSLPPKHFANLTALIVEHWSDWPANVAGAATSVLAVNAPEDLLSLFEIDLNRIEQGIPLDTERFLYVDWLVNIGTDERRRTAFNRLCVRVLALPDRDIGKSLLLSTLLRLAGILSADTLEPVLDAALRNETRDYAREGLMKQLFRGLFGHAEYLDLAIARGKNESQQRFEALAPFFSSDAPLATLDEWVDSLPMLANILPVDAMGNLGWEDFVPCLIKAMSEDQGDFLCEAAKNALVEIGHPAQEALIARWAELDRCRQIYGLSVIRNVGGTAAADFAVTHFDELMGDSVEFCCELALTTPDPRLLDRLRPELRRQQALIDRAYYIIARLLDRDGPEAQAAKDRALSDLRKSEKVRKSLDADEFARDPLSLELRCPACGAVNRYGVQGVILAGKQHKGVPYLVNDELPCASCGQEVEFEFTPMAQLALTAELMLTTVAHGNGQQQDSRVKFLDCQLDGQIMPFAAGLKKLRERVSRTPNDARAWVQMGNVLSHINRRGSRVNDIGDIPRW